MDWFSVWDGARRPSTNPFVVAAMAISPAMALNCWGRETAPELLDKMFACGCPNDLGLARFWCGKLFASLSKSYFSEPNQVRAFRFMSDESDVCFYSPLLLFSFLLLPVCVCTTISPQAVCWYGSWTHTLFYKLPDRIQMFLMSECMAVVLSEKSPSTCQAWTNVRTCVSHGWVYIVSQQVSVFSCKLNVKICAIPLFALSECISIYDIYTYITHIHVSMNFRAPTSLSP